MTRATSTASSLPFDPRLIGGQLAGLAVLAAAVTMVVARLSLRTPQLAQGQVLPDPGSPFAPVKTPDAPQQPESPVTPPIAQTTDASEEPATGE